MVAVVKGPVTTAVDKTDEAMLGLAKLTMETTSRIIAASASHLDELSADMKIRYQNEVNRMIAAGTLITKEIADQLVLTILADQRAYEAARDTAFREGAPTIRITDEALGGLADAVAQGVGQGVGSVGTVLSKTVVPLAETLSTTATGAALGTAGILVADTAIAVGGATAAATTAGTTASSTAA